MLIWNARRAAVGKWLSWCAEQGWTAPKVPVSAGRSTPPDSQTPVRSRTAIDRLIGRREIHLREKTLWRMLYETCARTEELLGLNVEDLDLAGRTAAVKSKGAKPRTRRRGATHHEHVLENVYWDAGTARLLPRLIRDRTRGPVFVTHRRPGPASTSPTATSAPTPALPGCPTTRPATCSTPPPPSMGPERAGTCTNCAIPA